MNIDELIIECEIQIKALELKKKKLLEQKIERRFYIGEKFSHVDVKKVYMLIRESETDEALLLIVESKDKKEIGWKYKYGVSTEIKVDTEQRHYVTRLPTCYPQDFDLDAKYGLN